jgi:hypothetical protein
MIAKMCSRRRSVFFTPVWPGTKWRRQIRAMATNLQQLKHSSASVSDKFRRSGNCMAPRSSRVDAVPAADTGTLVYPLTHQNTTKVPMLIMLAL